MIFDGEDITQLPAASARAPRHRLHVPDHQRLSRADDLSRTSRWPSSGRSSTAAAGRWFIRAARSSEGCSRRSSGPASPSGSVCARGSLSYGHQRLLEVAMGLALKPRLLILDEPTQGLSDGEIDGFVATGARHRTRSDGASDRAQHARGDGARRQDHRARRRPHPRRGNARRDPPRQSGPAMPISERRPMAEALTIEGLDCFYGPLQVLHGVGLALRRGEVLCLLGRNGAGKSTLLKAIMGLVPAASGSIRLGERELTALPAARGAAGRRRLCAAGSAPVRRAHRRREPDDRPDGARQGRGDARRRAGALPRARRTHPPAGWHAVRRRAADAGHGASALPRAEGAACSTSRRRV